MEQPPVTARLVLDHTDWPIRLSGGDSGISISTGSRRRGGVSQVYVEERLLADLAATRNVTIDASQIAGGIGKLSGITNPQAVFEFVSHCERFWQARG